MVTVQALAAPGLKEMPQVVVLKYGATKFGMVKLVAGTPPLLVSVITLVGLGEIFLATVPKSIEVGLATTKAGAATVPEVAMLGVDVEVAPAKRLKLIEVVGVKVPNVFVANA